MEQLSQARQIKVNDFKAEEESQDQPCIPQSKEISIHNGEEGLSIKHRNLKLLHLWQLQDKYWSRLCITGMPYGNFCYSLWVWYAYDKSDFLERTLNFFKASLNHISKIFESMFSPKNLLH